MTESGSTSSAVADAVTDRVLAAMRSARGTSLLTALEPTVRTARGDYSVSALREKRLDKGAKHPLLVVIVLERARNDADLTELLHADFGLTRRETAVALLVARRCTNAEIANDLGISQHTARHHAERVLRKLGVRTRIAAARKLSALSHA